MAYFSNGSDGDCLDEQCMKCKLGEGACPIYSAQMNFNYEAVNNKVATSILNMLIQHDGTCTMFQFAKQYLEYDHETLPLFNPEG